MTTLAFSEKGSRSHFWAPVSKAVAKNGRTTLSADKSWVTSAGEADSYVVSSLAVDAKGPTESTLYSVGKDARGSSVAGKFDGLGLRGNASAPMTLKDVELSDKDLLSAPGKGFDAMMGIVLPWFQVGQAAISLRAGRERARRHRSSPEHRAASSTSARRSLAPEPARQRRQDADRDRPLAGLSSPTRPRHGKARDPHHARGARDQVVRPRRWRST